MAQCQLHISTIYAGKMDEFVRGWREHVVPVRRACGFIIVGAWTNAQANAFAWMLRWDDPGDYASADEAYYDSPPAARCSGTKQFTRARICVFSQRSTPDRVRSHSAVGSKVPCDGSHLYGRLEWRMVTVEERKIREKQLQDRRFAAADGSGGGAGGAYAIVGASHGCYKRRLSVEARGKRVLEIGCGLGDNVLELAKCAAAVTGIDLSDVAVENAKARARELGMGARFEAMDAEATSFSDHSFDVVCGGAILHHLDTERAFREIARLLDARGCALFVEPLGHNPLINLYRRLTPSLRTRDEHPLVMHDLDLARKHFADVRVTYYYLTTLFALPIARTRLGKMCIDAANHVDRVLFRMFPGLRKHAWCIVLELRQPKP